MQISLLATSAMIDALTALINAGTPPGTIVFRNGTMPALTTTGDAGTLLATLTFANTSFGAGASGVATANAIVSGTAAASGTPTYFRLKNAAGTVIAQGSVGTSAKDMNFDSTTWVSGGTVAITSATLTMPAGTAL